MKDTISFYDLRAYYVTYLMVPFHSCNSFVAEIRQASCAFCTYHEKQTPYTFI
jgi:hypothetical protein